MHEQALACTFGVHVWHGRACQQPVAAYAVAARGPARPRAPRRRETDNRGTAFDNREERLLQHVLSTAPAGDAAAVVQAIDAYAWWVRVGEVALRG